MNAVQMSGMSGAGKTTIAAALARRGLAVIDADGDPLLARHIDFAGNVVGDPAVLGATRMNDLLALRTCLDNWGEKSPRSRTDLNRPGCLDRNLRIRRLGVRILAFQGWLLCNCIRR
jgi:hypothetical protein